ncbi:hypothetical protein L7F22_060643 [Adiantum nelumboides]|nr:hypothetical protein [Adiantum nelumboides]
MVKISHIKEPQSYEEAFTKQEWLAAMDEEYNALLKNDTWKLVDLPQGKKAIGSKWVYKVKLNANGSIDKHKARLVAKGFAQHYGEDYDETFAPVTKMTTVRLTIALATFFGLILTQMDIKNAFLNGNLEEEVYMHQPQDDLIITGSNQACIEEIKALLQREYEMKDLGELHYFLGIEIYRNHERTTLSQKKYVGDLLKRFNMEDAGWGGSIEDRRSTSGYCCSLGSGMITWSSKKQPTIALSSTEAEYRGVANVTCEVIWLRSMLEDIGINISTPTKIFCDNLSSIYLANNPILHARTKHIEVHYHFTREKVLEGKVTLIHCSTDNQVADIFTKPLSIAKFHMLKNKLLVGKCSPVQSCT